MIRTVFMIIIAIHGLIHLLGFAKAFGFAELPQLTRPISRATGILWLLAAVLMIATALALPLWPRGWWLLGLFALLASQRAIGLSWADAKFGTLLNPFLLVAVGCGFAAEGPLSLGAEYRARTRTAPAQPSAVLTDADLAALPAPVRRYVEASGAVGQARVRNFRLSWTGRIRSGPASPWMPFRAEQFNTLDHPSRFFRMAATRKGLPVDVLHAFDEAGATMRVRLLSLVPLVDAKGPVLTRAETVTLFNDLCLFAPGALVAPAIAWEAADAHSARAAFTLRGNTVRAELRFNDRGELVDFLSDDRLSLAPDGTTLTPMRWSTPVGGYAQMGPARVATHGEAVWHAGAGAYAYGEFELGSLAYNVEN
jgi:hypothetical protein